MVGEDFPQEFLAHIAAAKVDNKSNYLIGVEKIQEFARQCWAMLSDGEKAHYQRQIDNPREKLDNPQLSKFAFDINRALQSGYNQSVKHGSIIDIELANQVRNFKYLNLSNSALVQGAGIFQDPSFMENNFGRATGGILTALATFPSMEQLGYQGQDKAKFIEITAKILKEMVSGENNLLDKKLGVLSPNITAAVAIYVGENFSAFKDKTPQEIGSISQDLKAKCASLKASPSLEKVLDKLNGVPKLSKLEKIKLKLTTNKITMPSVFSGKVNAGKSIHRVV
jgi:hypothetical protein